MPFDGTQPYGVMADTRPLLYVQGGTIYKSTDFTTVADPTAYIFTTSGSGQGTTGQVLTSNGAGAAPTYQTAASGVAVANPGAQVLGLTAINGVAATALRSDGAP